MINYIKNNIKNLFINQKILTLLLIIVQISSVVIVLLSYGISNHYDMKTDAVEGTSLIYNINKLPNKTLTEMGYDSTKIMSFRQVDEFWSIILPYIENKLDYFFVMGYYDDIQLMSSTGYKDGIYTLSTQLKERVSIKTGRNFTEEDMTSGEKIAIVPKGLIDNDGYITIGNQKYRSIGSSAIFNREVFIPYASLPNDAFYYHTSIILKKPLLEDEYNYIVETAKKCYGNDVLTITEFEGINNESQNKVYRDIIIITVLLIIVCALNYCIIYRYILEKRRRIFAVSRICGCSKYKAAIVYMVELLGVSFVTLIIGLVLYANIVLPLSTESFEYIEYFYNTKTYLLIGGGYMGILFITYITLILKFVKKTPVSLISPAV